MRAIVLYFVTHRRVASLILALVVLLGIVAALNLERQAYPTIDFDIVKVITKYPGASPEDVEINVTEPIEDELLEVEDVDEIISRSMENLSMVTVYLNPNARDIRKLKNDIRDAVDRVSDLPAQITEKPTIFELRSGNRIVLEIALSGDVPEKELRGYAKSFVTDIRSVDGIGRITKVGYLKREIRIEADQDKIEDRYVSLGEIMGAIGARNVRTTGGSLESYVGERTIVTFAEYADPLDVRDVIVRGTFTGQRIRISDIAEIVDDFEEPSELARANGNKCISIIVRAQESSDIITMTDEVKERLESFKKGLPPGVTATLIFDDSRYTRSLLDIVINNAGIGFVLVMLVMFFFLDRKSAMWTALAIPVSICASMTLFSFFGITINSVTLIAIVLVLGMLVDQAIVISEKIYLLKERGMKPAAATVWGLKSVFWPVAASVATTTLAFLPMLFMKGITGKFVASIPVVVIMLLVFSLLESTLFLPSHIIRAKPPTVLPRRMRWIQRVTAGYYAVVRYVLKHRLVVLGIFCGALIATLVTAFMGLKFVLFPQEDPDVFNVVIEAPSGTPLTQTEEKIVAIEGLVREMVAPEIMESFTTRVGHHNTGVYGTSEGYFNNWAVITVYLKPAKERPETSKPLMEKIQKRLNEVEGFERLTVEAIDEGPPTGKPVTVTYVSDDDQLRDRFEQETIDLLKKTDGIYDIETTNRKGKEELRLMLDYDQMAKLGVTALDVARTVRAAFKGEVVTALRRAGEEIDYRVSLKDPKTYRAQGVLGLSITNRMGKLVPLKEFAYFEESASPSVIYHHDGIRSATITAEVEGDKLTSVEANRLIRKTFGDEVEGNANIRMIIGGEEKMTKESVESFFVALCIAIVAIYFLLVILFNSFVQPLIIMCAIPFSIIGVVATLMIHGLPLGFVALIGFLGLVGVVANNSIVMVSQLNESRRGFAQTIDEIASIAKDRFRPVLLTTTTTVAGLFPTAYGLGGDVPFIRPMVLVMVWGLLFSVLISLILIPIIYSLQGVVRKGSVAAHVETAVPSDLTHDDEGVGREHV